MQNFSVAFDAMGSTIEAWVNVRDAGAASILAQVPCWFEAWEMTFSRFRPESELCRVNRQAGRWTRVSEDMAAVISAAVDMAAHTHGLFNPLLLDAVEAAGYDHSFEPEGFIPGAAREPVQIGRYEDIRLNRHDCIVWLPAHTRLDLGGIAKGWAADHAADRLRVHGACLIDAGGDMAGRGSPDKTGGWLVAFEDPTRPDARLLLSDAAVATSGIAYRTWERDGQTLHHIIDPRTAQPASSSVLAATVVAPTAARAEAFAKAALISGETQPYATFLTHRDGTTSCNSAFRAVRYTPRHKVLA